MHNSVLTNQFWKTIPVNLLIVWIQVNAFGFSINKQLLK